ncbi:MAG: site-2 protease family protein [Acidimicrobiales bacterium]
MAGHGHSIPIGRIVGVPVRLHWTFFLLVAFVALVDRSAGLTVVASGLLWIVALFASVVGHEVAHCVVARNRGATVLDIVLFPLGGMSRVDAMPTGPGDEMAIAVAGPLTSVVLGAALLVTGALVGAHVWPPTLFAGNWWARLGWLNLLLAAFNMLPALPMDGGRVLRAGLARHRTNLEATVLAARVARYLALAMIVVGFFYDIWLMLIGLFVLLGASAEQQAAMHPPEDGHGPGGRGPGPRGPASGTDG